MSGKKLAVGFQYDTQRISDDFAQQFKATLLYEIENLETLGETNVDEVLNGFGLIRNDGCKSLTEIGLSSLEQLCLLGAINNRLGISLNEVDFFALCTVDDVFGVVDHHVCLRHTHFVKLTNGQRKTDLRIFGFPLAGVAASVFDPWCHMLPDNIAVHALAYPEPSVLSRLTFDDFINGIVAVLEDMSDQPMVFVGSSFGAIVAYEVSCRLKRPPEALLVIGSRTPDPENMRFTYHQMSDDMLNTQLKAMGSPEKEVLVIDNTLLRSAKDALRAVSQLAESYTSTSKLLTGCKVISIWPQEDTMVSCRQQQSWENLVPSDLYEFHSIKGGHRVLLDDPKEIFTIANVSSLVEVLVADR
jgi:surfactin synthase thioesterase subunit/acyl carrier protein